MYCITIVCTYFKVSLYLFTVFLAKYKEVRGGSSFFAQYCKHLESGEEILSVSQEVPHQPDCRAV